MKIVRNCNIHGEGLLNELDSALRSGTIYKVDDSAYVALLSQRYPFLLGRIDWSKVPRHLLLPAIPKMADEIKDPDRYFARRAPEFRVFIEGVARQYGFDMETPVLFMGDSVDFGLRMTLAKLMDYSPILFSFPQHVYAAPESCEWCFNYTYENDFFFGFAPEKRRKSFVRSKTSSPG